MMLRVDRYAVLGHVEWVEFVRVSRLPVAGEIVRASGVWQEAAGGGAVAAVQLARLAGSATLFTALGRDTLGRRARAELEGLGVELDAIDLDESQRRAITFVDDAGERTITVIGERLEPCGDDAFQWDRFDEIAGVYVCAGDAKAIRHARRARVVVATARILPALRESGIVVDALVTSANDASERYEDGDLDVPPRVVVRTLGADGGMYREEGRRPERYAPATPPGPVVDSYGAGDSFAAGLTFALGRGDEVGDAIGFAARCGAAVVAGRGPYSTQLRSAE